MDSLIEHFKPVLPIYPSEFRRQIYLEQFVTYAFTDYSDSLASPNYELPFKLNIDNIYRNYKYQLDEKDAQTIASFISYLGTNGGRCLLDTFQKYAESKFFRNKEDAFVHAWHFENSRQVGINNNLRTIEFLLTPLNKYPRFGVLDIYSVSEISVDQYELIEQTVKWLSTSGGVTYLLNCLELIDQAKDKTHEIRKLARQS